MYQNQKTNILVLSIVAVLAISLATPTAEAGPPPPLNIEWIAITSTKDFVDGTAETDSWSFEMWVDFVDSTGLDHIDVTTSGSTPFTTISEDKGGWGWSSQWSSPSYYSDLDALRSAYPLETYTLDFYDDSSHTTLLNSVELVYSGLPEEPSKPVDFTYPASDGATGISINPTFTWTVDSGDGDALTMIFEDVGDEDLDWAAPVAIDTTEWPVGPLLAGREYMLEVSVCEVKDWVGPLWPTMTGTVVTDTFSYTLMNEYLNSTSFTTTPVPGAVFLGAIGISMVGWLCRRKEPCKYLQNEN